MMQLVVWMVIATINPNGEWANAGRIHGDRFVAAYTNESACQRHAQEANDGQQRALSKTPNLIYEFYGCRQVVAQTECHLYTDGRCGFFDKVQR